MNHGLTDAIRHNIWATRELLTFCRDLTDEQWRATTVGVFGDILETFWHIIAAEASYQRRLIGQDTAWDWRVDEAPGLEDLISRSGDLAARWEKFLSMPFDPEHLVEGRGSDGTVFEYAAGVVLAQALHHASEHRTQICAILTGIGLEPPNQGAWEYALTNGRGRVVQAG